MENTIPGKPSGRAPGIYSGICHDKKGWKGCHCLSRQRKSWRILSGGRENTAEGKERNGETEKTAFCFVNTPTEIQASKTVDLGETKKFNLNDRIFGFTLTNNGKVQGTYHAVIAMETEKENGTAVVTKSRKILLLAGNFTSKTTRP